MTKSRNLGMRLLSLALSLVCIGCLVKPTKAAPADQKQTTLTTVVRNGAYASSAVIGQMEDATEVTVLGEKRDFYKVDCYDMTGYIAKSQIVHTDDDRYYVNCNPESPDTRTMAYTDHADALALRHSLLALAKEQLGEPYIYGSSGPYGFDCSGLMYYLYAQHGISLLRTASNQLQDGIVVSKEGLQVGDLIFFRERWEYYPASHVGIYAGNNQIIHAGHDGIVYADLDFDYFAENYLCVRRIVNTNAAALEDTAAAISMPSVTAPGPATGRRGR